MNSKGHLYISLVKSTIRLGSALTTAITLNILPMAIGFALAEILGYVEELVDKR